MESIQDPSNVSSLGLHQLCQPSSLIIKPHTLQLSNNLLDGILRVWVCPHSSANEKNKNRSSYKFNFNFSASFNLSSFLSPVYCSLWLSLLRRGECEVWLAGRAWERGQPYLTLTLGEGRYLLFRSSSSRTILMTPGTGTTCLRGRGRIQSGVGLGIGLEEDKN